MISIYKVKKGIKQWNNQTIIRLVNNWSKQGLACFLYHQIRSTLSMWTSHCLTTKTKHCNVAQIWSWCTEYSSFVFNRYPVISVILCVGDTNGKIKIVSSFSAIKLCFVINVLNNKTIILLNLAEYRPTASSAQYQAIFRAISQDNC